MQRKSQWKFCFKFIFYDKSSNYCCSENHWTWSHKLTMWQFLSTIFTYKNLLLVRQFHVYKKTTIFEYQTQEFQCFIIKHKKWFDTYAWNSPFFIISPLDCNKFNDFLSVFFNRLAFLVSLKPEKIRIISKSSKLKFSEKKINRTVSQLNSPKDDLDHFWDRTFFSPSHRNHFE